MGTEDFVFGATAPQWARASSFTRFLDHKQRCTTVSKTPLDEGSARRRDKTQRSQQSKIHAPGGIQTHNLSRRAAVDPRLRPSGHLDRYRTVRVVNKKTEILHYNSHVSLDCFPRPQYSHQSRYSRIPQLTSRIRHLQPTPTFIGQISCPQPRNVFTNNNRIWYLSPSTPTHASFSEPCNL
jgi:hypothetical protein